MTWTFSEVVNLIGVVLIMRCFVFPLLEAIFSKPKGTK